MRFLADERLYHSTRTCLAFLRDLESPPATTSAAPERVHLYWHGEIGRKPALAIRSFLATQDLATAELWLWLDHEHGYPGHEENPLLRPLLPHLRVLPFDPARESAKTPLAAARELRTAANLVWHSNFVRFVVLFVHGGTWVDIDTLFLRDFGPLRHDPRFGPEFAYRWSAHLPYANSAVLRLEAGGEVARRLLLHCVARGSCRPRDVLRFEDHPALDLVVLPCPFFDPLWPSRDGRDPDAEPPFADFPGFFRRLPLGRRWLGPAPTLRGFFPGAFAYHWHNGWAEPEHADSHFGHFDRELDAILEAKLGVPAPRSGARV